MIELNFPNPVTSEEGFFDREKDWERIRRAFRSRETRSVIIQGDRRIGKTSLQAVAARRLAQDRSLNLVPLSLPFGPLMHSRDDVAKEILHTLCVYVGQNPRDTKLFDVDGQFQMPSVGEFWQVIEGILARAPGQTFVICIDEFDSMLKNCSLPEQSQVLHLFQDLMERRTDLPLALFLSMTSFDFSEADIAGSPLVSKSASIVLGCFSEGDMREMVQKLLAPRASIQEGGMERLFELSGGHPYVTKLLLDSLLASRDYDTGAFAVDRALVEQGVTIAIDDARARSALMNLYDVHYSGEEKELMLLLAERQVRRRARVTKEELKVFGPDYMTAAEALARRGYLERTLGERDPEDGGYVLRIAFLGYWLRHWERYESETEKRLKSIRQKQRRMVDPWEDVEPTVVTEEDLRRFGLRP
jgi:hypothetical protein